MCNCGPAYGSHAARRGRYGPPSRAGLQRARTFSRADAPEPPEPQGVRANCCARIAGPAMGFVELPDRSMRWSPVPHRGGGGIAAWTGMWLCLRCQQELQAARVQVPQLQPRCDLCHVPMWWEVDMRAGTERWVCNRCPLAGHTRPLSLAALLPGPPQLEHSRQLSTQRPSAGSVARARCSQLRPAQPLTAFSSGPLTCRCGPPRTRACMCRCCWMLLASWPRRRATPGIPILPLCRGGPALSRPS